MTVNRDRKSCQNKMKMEAVDIIMDVKKAYSIWADQYDTNENRTRDLEGIALKATLQDLRFEHCLEIGCGTGKNTEFLLTRSKQVTAIDFSSEMLDKAKQKITSGNVQFIQADITADWDFARKGFDLVTFSLVLEHIEDLNDIFKKVSGVASPKALVYLGELHPFKQYSGTRANFKTGDGLKTVTCFDHNLSDFTEAAKQNGFTIIDIAEYFDDNDRTTLPRILIMLFQAK